VASSTGVESFAEVRESSDFDPGGFSEVQSFGKMLVGGVIVLKPEA
jgi:hypothetical protein